MSEARSARLAPGQGSVAVVGASEKEGRYSRKAMELLREKSYEVIPIRPGGGLVLGTKAYDKLSQGPSRPHTVTMYVGAAHSMEYLEELLALRPARVIFNPGAESDDLEAALTEAGIACVRACTLVLLRTGQF
jgi:hypothetical protein